MPSKAETITLRAWPEPAAPARPPGLAPSPRQGLSGPARGIKRAEDICGALIALLVFAVPMLLLALAIRLDSPGPILFRQPRTGLNNRSFVLLKFRTMRHDRCEPRICAQAQRRDPRLTRLGAFLRRTSLDELPQLFNVLRGEMALVGPRPHAPETRAAGRLFPDIIADYPARHLVKPGITGLAQVRGQRGETGTEEALIRRVASDFEYIHRWSVWLDAVILLRTAICVLRMKNAY